MPEWMKVTRMMLPSHVKHQITAAGKMTYMKTRIQLLLLVWILFSILPLNAQEDDVLITIGDIEIRRDEFERIYRKNNQNLLEESEVKSPEEYIGLFVNFKLKVVEAMNLKMDTIKSFRDELGTYRKQLAAPYLTDMKYDEALIEELYTRMTREVNASHILFRVPENASGEEENAVLQKAGKVKEEIATGKDFSEAAQEYSEDPSARHNMGNLGYFSAFQMVAPFENAAFTTPEGQISDPVRTSYGYHLIQVHDIRENRGEVKVAHIMKMFPQEEDFDKSRVKAEIDSIYQKLLNGAEFGEMARHSSDDKRSAVLGGEMPWFSAGNMIPEFSEPAFSLKNNGDFTKPVESAFGYHIIKKLDHRPVPSFGEVRADIENRIKKDPERSLSTKKAFLEKLKNEVQFTENREKLAETAQWKINANTTKNPLLFTVDSTRFTLGDFNNYLQEKNITAGTYGQHYEVWRDDEILALEDAKLEEKYPEFRYLMQEYHDGLLLFNIMEEKIWNFAAEDSVGLAKFYAKNRKKFFWQERFKGMVITCEDTETRREADKFFDAGMTPEEVEDVLNGEKKMISIERGAWENGTNQIVDYYIWNSPAPPGFDSEITYVRGDLIPPEPKTLNEARGLYISEYQNMLEKLWLKSLRKKYKVKVNKKLLKTISDV
jgi:peptidyl-prolyl cis-trans isomerase SurA